MDKHKALHPGKTLSRCAAEAGIKPAGEELCGEGPGVQQGRYKWTLCCCCSKARQQEAGLHHQQRYTSHHPALLSACQATPGVLCSVLVPAIQKSCGQAGEGPENSHKDDQRTGKLPCEERLGQPGLSSLEKRRLRVDLITLFQCLKDGYKEDGNFLFTKNHREKNRSMGYKFLLGRFWLDTKRKFFTIITTFHWNNVLNEVADSPALDTCKIWLDRVLVHLV